MLPLANSGSSARCRGMDLFTGRDRQQGPKHAGPSSWCDHQGNSEKIFPGFMMFFGSSARLMLRIIVTAPGPASSSR